jgi:hypothetical protein
LLVKQFEGWYFLGFLKINYWWLLPISVLLLIGAGIVTLLMPRGPKRRPVAVLGHPVGPAVLGRDRASLR